MLIQCKPMRLTNFQLVFFNQRVFKFHNIPALKTNQMIVVALAIQLFK